MARQILFGAFGAVAALGLLLSLPAGGANGEASAKPRSIVHTPIDAMPARHASTYADDRLLANSCIEAGRPKMECLCVTKVLKYELTVRDYRAAARLYSHPAAPRAIPSSTRIGLSSQGMSATQITDVRRALSGLVEMPDFADRCMEADRFFTGGSS